ncbi:ABC transporter substrate-binding protein [Microbacterium trichothecenolyticum]|uniref:Peptide/nickel transport system substrate-binding protein n=1 Tax=Microbacterium trichothecenolyticum TaxID=69370 RepID=A0ABU0TPC3_MICTR|nr:ABC transporter substrate-binding protein [Microbacterium trichothecenolyticum]MDQ1121514.1 peptide/nickel transport system substrate-binding protein [Microbacterium trichothecenolyticum]
MRSTSARIAVAALTTIALGLGGCSATGSTNPQDSATPVAGGDLVIARSQDASTLDVNGNVNNWSIWADESVLDTLLVPSPDGKGVEPSLATSWEVSDDKKTWTFHLRPGVTFSNGQALTSADVKFSIDYARDPKASFGFLDAAIADVTATDPETVTITTSTPWAPLLADLAGFNNSIFPANFAGQSKDAFWEKPIGSGPFMFDSWVKGSSLKLVRNPHYWKSGLPYLDSVTFLNVPEDQTRATMLQSGQAQIDEFPAYSSLATLKATTGVTVDEFPSSNTEYLVMNNERPEFSDPHVRRAISYALDRDAMIKAVLFGHGEAAKSFLNPSLMEFADVDAPTYDVDKAKQELAQSAYPQGFTTTLLVASGKSMYATAAQIIQASLKELGIEVEIQTIDADASGEMQNNANYDMCLTYFTTDIVDPDEWVTFGAVSPKNGFGNAMNTFYSNPELDALAQRGREEFDPDTRTEIYQQIQQIIADDQPHASLYYTPFEYARSTKVHGFQVYPTGNYTLAETWVEQ